MKNGADRRAEMVGELVPGNDQSNEVQVPKRQRDMLDDMSLVVVQWPLAASPLLQRCLCQIVPKGAIRLRI